MKGEWCYYKQYFTPEECKYILDHGLQQPSADAKLGASGESVRTDSKYRKSQIRFINKPDANFDWLFDRMWKIACEANDIWFGVHISKIDYIQLAEYDSSYLGEYKDHHDVFFMNNDPYYHRKLSAVIQLTDPSTYEGGSLEFPQVSEQPNAEEINRQGTVIFFPSLIVHRATPVTSGIRHSLACWFDGPKWR